MVQVGVSFSCDLEDLPRSLDTAAQMGVDAVELNAESLDLIFNGKLHPGRTQTAIQALKQYPFRYSLHASRAMNLRTRTVPEKTYEVMLSSMELSRLIGSSILVVHFEKQSEDEALERQFAELLLKAADQADGVTLAVENIEIESSLKVADLVERLNHPAIRMTYDLGHDHVASSYYGYDYEAAAARCAPFAAHLHINDNFGQFEETRLTDRPSYNAFGNKNWTALGRGDLHLPIGWGCLPYEAIIRHFKGYNGLLIAEVRDRFFKGHKMEIAEGLQRIKQLFQ